MTEFTQKVYKIVSQIPKGQVLTYKEVATRAGHPLAYRAVGNILNKNHNPEVYCHRVIKSDGSPGGFNLGTGTKVAKLEKEGFVLK